MSGDRDYLEHFGRLSTSVPKGLLSSLQAFWQLDRGGDCKACVTFSVNRFTLFFFLSSTLSLLSVVPDIFKVEHFWFNFFGKETLLPYKNRKQVASLKCEAEEGT